MEITKQNSYLREYVLKCPICYELFSSFHKPLIIPCGHTICSHCVENLKKMSEEEYDEEYASEINDEEFDISLNTEEEENEEEDGPVSRNETEDEESETEETDDEDEEDEEEEEQNEDNSITLDQVEYPDIHNLINEVNIQHSTGASNFSALIPKSQQSTRKIKLKCSICRKKMKILESEIIINTNVMNVINSTDFQSSPLGTSPTKDSSPTAGKTIFCKLCRFVDLDKNHLVRNSTHGSAFLELDNELFNKIKSDVLPKQEINTDSISDNTKSISGYLDKENKLNKQIIGSLSMFLENLINSKEFLNDSKEYIKNYFLVNSKANYLKHKSFRKLTKLYGKFNKFVTEMEAIPSSDKQAESKLPPLMKKAEDCLESANILLNKYFKITEIYLTNYDKIFKIEEDIQDQENIVISNSIDDHMTILVDKLFQDKSLKILRSGFFEPYFNKILDSQRRYAACVDNSSNLIFIYDLRVENELEVNYDIVFESLKVPGLSQDEIEVNFSDYIEIDEEGRYIYIIGKRAKDSKTLRCYDMNTRALTTKKKMPLKIGVPDRYFYNNKLYLLGGANTNATHYFKECYYYDTQADWWVDLPPLNFSRYDKSIAICDKKFYVFGGRSYNNEDMNKFEILDLNKIDIDFSKFKWNYFTLKNKSLYSRNVFYSFLTENLFVVLGGEDQHDEEIHKGFLIKFSDIEDLNNSEVIEEFNLKNGMSNTFNVCSSFKGLLVGSRVNDGYFNKINFSNNIKKLKTII